MRFYPRIVTKRDTVRILTTNGAVNGSLGVLADMAGNRLGFSRVRQPGTGLLDRERLVAASCCQNRPDRARRLEAGVGPWPCSLVRLLFTVSE